MLQPTEMARRWGTVALLLLPSIGCSSPNSDGDGHACVVRHSSYEGTKRYAFDEESGRLTTAEYIFMLDANAGTIAVYGSESSGAI